MTEGGIVLKEVYNATTEHVESVFLNFVDFSEDDEYILLSELHHNLERSIWFSSEMMEGIYEELAGVLTELKGRVVTQDMIKDRVWIIKTRFLLFNPFLKCSGVKFDEATGVVEVNHVKYYILMKQPNPIDKRFTERAFLHFDLM